MALVDHKLEARDLLDLSDVQLIDQGPLLDSLYDPESPDYRPDLVPRDPDTGQPFLDSLFDPNSPDYRPDLDPERKSLWDVGTSDWIFSKASDLMLRNRIEEDPNFEQPWGDLDTKYDEYADDFAATRSKDEWDYLKYTIDQSFQNHEFMRDADFGDMAGYMGVQLLDPALLPLYFLNLVKLGAAGAKVSTSAGKMAGYAAAEGALIETALQTTDPTRTAPESLATVGAAGIMGSLFGMAGQTVVNRLGARGMQKVQQEAEQLLEANIRSEFRRPLGESQSIGAGGPTTLADEKPVFNPVKKIMIGSPTLRLVYDKYSAAASRAIDRLVPHNILKQKHLAGQAAEETPLYSAIMQVREQNTATMVSGIRAARQALAKRGVRLSEDEIATMVGKAARRGDEHPEHAEITKLAAQFRKIADDWGGRAKKVGLISEEALESVSSYFPRIYDVRRISKNFGEWTNIIGKHFRKDNPELTDIEIEEIASSIHDTLMNNGVGKTWQGGFKVPGKVMKSGHFKGRTLDISDLDIEDFLVDDVRYVTQHYFRSIAPGVLVREMFGADSVEMLEGTPVIRSILDDMKADYDLAKMHLKDAGKSTLKLDESFKRAKKDMQYVMASVLGYHDPTVGYMRGWGQLASQELRSFTGAMALGNLVLSAIPDMANLILSHGLTNLIKSAPAILRPRKWTSSAKVDFDALAIGIDTIMSTRMLRMADLEERHLNAFTRGIGGQATANFAFKYFGANLWNSWMKRAAGTASMNRILTDVSRYASLGKGRKARLAQLGIDEATAQDFATQYAKQAEKRRQGVRWADFDSWEPTAASKLQRILYRDVETTIVTPQAADMPKILDNEAGLLIAQFKRFVMSHQLQIMTQAAQRLSAGDLAVVNYIVAGAGLGMLSHYLRTQAKHGFDQDEVEKALGNMTASDWMFHAVDRGALLSFGTDMLMGVNGLTDGYTGQMLGFSDVGRYQMAGMGLEQKVPGLGTLSRVYRLADAGIEQATGHQQFNQKDLHNARQLVPLQNTFYLAWLFDQIEESMAEEMNLPKGSRQRKIRN